MTAPVASSAALTAGYVAQQQTTRTALAAYLAALWATLTAWRTPDADRFAAQAATAVTGGQQRVAATTTAYLTALFQAAGHTPPAVSAGAAVDDQMLRGVPAAEVYRRPFEQLWWDLSQNRPLEQAVAAAERRVQVTAATDLQLAKTHTSRAVLEASGEVVGYRRVLTGDRSCALCLVASTQRYHKAALLPIHPRCDCAVAPIFAGQHDAGQVIDADLLNAIHDAVARDLGAQYVDRGARNPLDYRKVIVSHEHGELGPVLAVNGQHFTGAADLP